MASSADDSGCKVPGVRQPDQARLRQVRRPVDPEATQPGDRQGGDHGVSGHVRLVYALRDRRASRPTRRIGRPPRTGSSIRSTAPLSSTDYASPMGTLNDRSNLVKAVGDNAKSFSGCLPAPGGEGTFYAQAVAAAQAALRSRGFDHRSERHHCAHRRRAHPGAADALEIGDGHMDATYAVTKCSDNSCSPGHRHSSATRRSKPPRPRPPPAPGST